MKMKAVAIAIGLALAAGQAQAAGNTYFDDVNPLIGAATPVPVGSFLEGTNALLLPSSPSASLFQTSIADRATQLLLGQSNSGAWDMIDTNHTGPDAGRYLFMPFESSTSGAQRIDLLTGQTTTIVDSGTQGWMRGDTSRWTPWGTWVSGEENFTTGTTGTGRLFEVTNPVTAGPSAGNLVQRNSVVPLVSQEGLVFDQQKRMYFIDEFASGAIYRYTPNTPNATTGADYFAAGQVTVLSVPNGNKAGANGVANTTGAATWSPITGLDGRSAADVVNASSYNRPEDMEIKTLPGGAELIVTAVTGTNEVYSLNVATGEVKVFANQATIDIATGQPVGALFSAPDNIALDADGNFYIVEDQDSPNADIWLAKDANNDGVAEYVQRWVALKVAGAEPTGLFFSLKDPNVAFVNIQHPTSGNDRTMMLTAVPEPGEWAMLLAGFAAMSLVTRRRLKKRG